jgi:hypothetical protein
LNLSNGAFRFYFDPINKIFLLKFSGAVDELVLEDSYREWMQHAKSLAPWTVIADFSEVTVLQVSGGFVRDLAGRDPGVDPVIPQFVVVSSDLAYSWARLFQGYGEKSRPRLRVVRSMNEALQAVEANPPRFEPLPSPSPSDRGERDTSEI